MPKLPGAEDIGGPVSGRSGRAIASVDTSAIGRGVATLGQGLRQFGEGVKSLEGQKQSDADQATKFETQRRFLEFSASQDDALQKAGDAAQPGAFGFRETVAGEYQKKAKEFFSTVPDTLKGEYDARLFQVEDGLAGRAHVFEKKQRGDYYTTKTNEGLTLIENKLYSNPSAFDANLAEGNKFIDSIPDEDVGPIAKDALRRDWKAKAQFASLNGMTPGDRVTALGGAPVSDGNPVDTVVDRIIGAESGGNATAKNPKSSAEGLGQFIDSTWLATVRQHRPDIAAGKTAQQILALKTDPNLSREMTKAYTSDNGQYLSNRHLPTTAGNLYLAHFLGPQGAVSVLSADPGSSVESVIGGDAVRANPFLAGKTVADLKAWSDKKMGGKGVVDPRFADMTWQDRNKIIDSAQVEIRQKAAEDRVASQFVIENAATNAPIAIQNTGEYLGQMPTQDQFVAAYGDKAVQKFKEFEQALDTSRQAFGMQTMPEGQIASLVESAEPNSSGDDAALQQDRYQILSTAAANTLKARDADPAGYVRQAFPAVDQAWAGVTAPGGYQQAISASIAAQQQLGIANIKPLPKDVAADAVEGFKDTNLAESDRIAAATNVLMATPDPTQRQALFEQLVDAGLPEITEGAFEAMSRGDQGASQRLFQAAMVDPSKLPGKAPATPTEIDTEVQSTLMDAGTVGDIYYGLSDGSAENFERAQRDSKLISNSVNLRMRNGESMSDAIASVSKDLYGDVQVVEGYSGVNAQVLAPADADPEAIVTGLASLQPEVRTALEMAVAVPGDAATADGSKAVLDAATSGYVDNVMSEGYFRNSGDGYVFIDPFVGAAISGPDGNPIIFKMPRLVVGEKMKRPFGSPSTKAIDENAARQSVFQ